MLRSSMHRQVLLLSSAQALFQTVSVLVMTVGGLAGGLIAPEPQFATAPIAAMFLGTAVATVPASIWMARAGRRTGFVAGAALGTLGGLVAAFGVLSGSLLVLCLGTMLVGAYQGILSFCGFGGFGRSLSSEGDLVRSCGRDRCCASGTGARPSGRAAAHA